MSEWRPDARFPRCLPAIRTSTVTINALLPALGRSSRTISASMQLGMLATFRLQFPRRGQRLDTSCWAPPCPSHLLARFLWRSSGRAEQTRNMPLRYALRLDDLRPWHVIVVSCAACRRRAHVAGALLRHGRPPYTRLLDLERKLCCTGCGSRRGNTLTVSMAPRN